jgi:di/tripeptidase
MTSLVKYIHFPGDQLIAMDGHNLLNLKYEEAMNLFQSSGAEIEILLSQINIDKGISESQEEPCVVKAVGEDSEFQLPFKHETDCRGTSLIPMVHQESSYVKSVEDTYRNNIQYKTATSAISGDGESEKLSTSVTAKMKSMQKLHYEKPPAPVRSNHDSITEDDKVSTDSSQYM